MIWNRDTGEKKERERECENNSMETYAVYEMKIHTPLWEIYVEAFEKITF